MPARRPSRPSPAPGAHAAPAASPLVAAGATAVNAARASLDETRPRDDLDAARASDERHPQPFGMTAPRAGGPSDGQGVAGPREDDGHSARATVNRAGAGGTPLDVPLGRGQPATIARPPGRLLPGSSTRGVLEGVKYPPELAITFEQGEVVVTFTLRRDGSVANMKVGAAQRLRGLRQRGAHRHPRGAAFRTGAGEHLAGRRRWRVNAPFTFDNPLIR